MIPPPPGFTPSDTLFPFTTLFRSDARFAKLPSPRLQPVEWRQFVAQLRSQVEFVVDLHPADGTTRLDAAQVEQALLNLLRNAHESGSAPEERSEEHTSELQSLMRISYAVFCLHKKKTNNHNNITSRLL